MATIFYGLSGEGRGHATRARTIVEALRANHDVTLFAPGQAHELLYPLYRGTDVRVRRIPGLRFHYTSCRRIDFSKTTTMGLRYLAELPRLVRVLQQEIERHAPDLVVTDFEPALPRAAEKMGVPYISVDHQHVLVVSDFSALPPDLRRYVFYMEKLVRAYYSTQQQTVVSSFFFPPSKVSANNVSRIGVLLRPEVMNARTRNGRHLVAYLRREVPPAVLHALKTAGCEVRLYGLGGGHSDGNIRYCEVDNHRFVEDLATGRGLISTAGNQLVGEALYLGKPVLAMPERKNHEQRINAHFLKATGLGMTCDMDLMSHDNIRAFMNRLGEYRTRIGSKHLCGNAAAIRAIESQLPGRDPSSLPVPYAELEAVA